MNTEKKRVLKLSRDNNEIIRKKSATLSITWNFLSALCKNDLLNSSNKITKKCLKVLSLWMKNGIPFIRDKTVEAADGGIVLMDITAEDAGEYSRNDKRYKITVDTGWKAALFFLIFLLN